MKKIYEWKDYLSLEKENRSQNLSFQVQVCIIGTGCGGATLGAFLSEKGISTLLIEKGGYYPTATFDNHELTMAGKISGNRNLDTTDDTAINLVYGNNVGGASVHYWADSYRTPKDRLELWEEEYGIQGHSESKLKPYWDRLEKRLNVHPATNEYLNKMNQLIEKESKKLGWKGHRVPQARKNCQKSGHCMQGCAFAAKQSQLVTHIEDIIENGGIILADLEAETLVWNKSQDKVESLVARVIHRPSSRPTNTLVKIQADIFVVAAGGFHSSAFLLKNGLAKRLPALGSYVSINPSPSVFALYPMEIQMWRNIPAGYGIDGFRLAKYYSNGNYKEGGYLIMPNQLQPGTLAALMPLVGESHFAWMKNLSRIGGTIGWIDDIPSELGRIYIKKSFHGISKKVEYPIRPITSQMLKDLILKQIELNLACGAEEVLVASHRPITIRTKKDIDMLRNWEIQSGDLIMAAPHPAGGCRMGKDPKNSVVNSQHRVHGVKNLYVSDSSVFPTGVSVDPSFTIMAFSFIAGESILDSLG